MCGRACVRKHYNKCTVFCVTSRHVTSQWRHRTCISIDIVPSSAGEYVYWSDKPVRVNPTKIINTVPIMQARPTSPVYHAFAVHATAFALLVYLRNNWVVEARPVMKWLQTQRNFNGGFSAPEVSRGRVTCAINRPIVGRCSAVRLVGCVGWMCSFPNCRVK